MLIPTQCQLWQKEQVTSEDIRLSSRFEILNTFEDDSHLVRHLLRCRDCGQLYFYEFYEWIDWIGGNDPQYHTFLPIESDGEARKLAKMTSGELLQFYPRLQKDWPADAERPTIRWVK
jgi:hypothetical protein